MGGWVDLLFLAQTSDPISGGAGWVGAGLLGLVLSWLLLKHLPDKDRQTERLVAQHLESEAKQRGEHVILEREQRAEFRGTLEQMMSHSRAQVEGLGNALRADLVALKQTLEALDETVKLFLRQQNGK